jgi:hypothetical protein
MRCLAFPRAGAAGLAAPAANLKSLLPCKAMPFILLIAAPNGAGKTSFARKLTPSRPEAQRRKRESSPAGGGVTWASFPGDPLRWPKEGVGRGTLRRQLFEAILAPVPVT